MLYGKWTFRPGLASSLAALLVVPVLIALGFWQLDRADQKQVLADQYHARDGREAVDLKELMAGEAGDINWYRVRLEGTYLDNRVVLLDNQVSGGQAGYYVYSPFEIPGLRPRVLVNRGWVPAGEYRSNIPAIENPSGKVVLQGKVKLPPGTGILLSADIMEEVSAGVIRTQTIDLEKIGEMMGINFAPFIVRLEPGSATGFHRDWPEPGFGRERHLGYAYQWFAMAATVVIIFVVLNTGRTEKR